jgi:hypothetical protein
MPRCKSEAMSIYIEVQEIRDSLVEILGLAGIKRRVTP